MPVQSIDGFWPDVDVHIVEDYKLGSDAPRTSTGDIASKWLLRVHMDIEIADPATNVPLLRRMLQKDDGPGIVKKVLEITPTLPGPGRRGLATLKAAVAAP